MIPPQRVDSALALDTFSGEISKPSSPAEELIDPGVDVDCLDPFHQQLLDALKDVNLPDLTLPRRDFVFQLPSFMVQPFMNRLKAPDRDWSMVHLMLNLVLTVLPAAVTLLAVRSFSHFYGVLYLALSLPIYLPRFILWLHYTSHSRVYHNKDVLGRVLNAVPEAFAPLFGIPWGMYHLHHCVMHHCENNVFPWDVSSTEPYQRDNFFHFLFYWLRFYFGIWIELPYYAYKRHRFDLVQRYCVMAVVHFSLLTALYQWNPLGCIYVLLLPHLLTSFLLMFGNWSQHIFIDARQPESNYSLTINCINSPSNQVSFNDGYHILHHSNSQTHWSQFPSRFAQRDTLQLHQRNDALVFNGVDFFEVGVMVFTGNLKYLAKHIVPLRQRTPEQWVDEFKKRLTPILRHEE